MAFMDMIGKKIAQTGQETVQKTKNMAESVKLSSMVTDEEKKIRQLFSEIGEMYYQIHRSDPENTFTPYIMQIVEAEERVSAYSERIKQLKGIAKCPNCGGEVPDDVPFCNTCGAQMLQSGMSISEETVACPECGALQAKETVFCMNCGSRMEKNQEKGKDTAICPKCGKQLPSGAQFCSGCGGRLE